MPLVINSLGGGHTNTHTHTHIHTHTHTYTHIQTSAQKQFQETRHVLARVESEFCSQIFSLSLHVKDPQ